MGVTVAYVGEGDGLRVDVGVAVGGGGEIRLKPPHAMRSKASVDIPIGALLVIMAWNASTTLLILRQAQDAFVGPLSAVELTMGDSNPRESADLRG
jgi:hypothetical protein